VRKYFLPTNKIDQFGDYSKLSDEVLDMAEEIRRASGKAIYVMSGYREGDPKFHGKGMALDLICPGLSLYKFFAWADTICTGGIGLYPHWKFHDGVMYGGLHIDTGPAGRRWLGVKDPEGSPQRYIALNRDNLKKYLK
jgi:uncharacterized protein YcbK (DUF882 family)